MNVGRASGRAAATLGKVVVGQGESSAQRGFSVRAGSRNGLLSTRSALGASQAAARLAAAKLPLRQPPAVQVSQVGASAFLSTESLTSDQKAVMKATENWRDTVTSNTDDAPKKTAALYAPDALFWGTVSEQVRDTPQHVYEYFDFFARMPKLRMTRLNPGSVRMHGDIAIQAGDYTFMWQAADGSDVEVDARFTFSFRREKDG
ncbi:unnamed protein product, partial [Pylaiella littoralis]